MQSLVRIIVDIFVISAVVATAWFVYVNYGDQIKGVFDRDREIIFIGELAIEVTVADDQNARLKGLSRVDSLEELEGKLFIFDRSDTYGIWMKDMRFPIDIIWINDDLEIVDIKENVTPDTYPTVFYPKVPARFVLETNAYFVESFNISKGQRVNMPSLILPDDIKQMLQQ